MHNKNFYNQNKFFIFIFLSYLFLIFTNNYVPLQVSVNMGFNDQVSYYQIMDFSPNLSETPITPARAQRFVLSYLIGASLNFYDLKEFYYNSYLIFNILTHIFVIYFLIKIFNLIFLDKKLSLIFLLIIIFNPYIFRASLFAPLMLNDQLFILGSVILIYSFIRNDSFYLLFGVILSSLCRQTSMVFIPCFCIYLLYNILFQKDGLKIFNINLLISIFLIFFNFYFTYEFSKSFSLISADYLIDKLSGIYLDDYSLKQLAIFIARYFVANLYIIILFVLLVSKQKLNLKLDFKFYIIFLIGIGIISQPLLAGPEDVSGNINRLTALASPFFVIFFAKSLTSKSLKNLFSNNFFLFLLLLSSFHHNYSKIPLIDNLNYFILIFIIFIINMIYIFKKKL